jgi:hypothetical protein
MQWYGKDKEKYLKDGMELLDQAGWALSRRHRDSKNKVSTNVSCINLYDFAVQKGCIVNEKKKFTEKTIVGNWSYLVGLIAGYFDGDGCVSINKKSKSIRIVSVIKKNLQLLQIALSSLGINSKIYTETRTKSNTFEKRIYKYKPMSTLVVSSDSMNRFLKIIPIRNIDKLDRLNKIERERQIQPKRDQFLDSVISIEELEEQEVYDCEVENIHAFDANSLYVHNCVVVAGAREPMSFTHYFGHQYIQTNGCLPCSESTACWKCKLDGCKQIQESRGMDSPQGEKFTPKCVEIIKPSEVVDSIKKYYEGGRLQYGKKIQNKFFKNIVNKSNIYKPTINVPIAPPVIQTEAAPIELKFGGSDITEKDWSFIDNFLQITPTKTVLQFGIGIATVLFMKYCDKVVIYETNQSNKLIEYLKTSDKDSKLDIRIWDGKYIRHELPEFDLAFIDGPPGGGSREFSTKISSEHAKILLIHDENRKEELKWKDKYIINSFIFKSKGGNRCAVWEKLGGTKVPEVNMNLVPTIELISKENENVIITPVLLEKPNVRLVSTARGWGGCARSITTIMKFLIGAGHHVEFVPFHSKYTLGKGIGGEFAQCLSTELKDVAVRDYSAITEPCEVTFVYFDDYIFEASRPDLVELFSKLKTDRKIMMLNYRRGKVGEVEWTQGWDKYMFLNSTQEADLIRVYPGAKGKTKVLPPCTILEPYLHTQPNYNEPLKLIRHSSQGDTKFPKQAEWEQEITAIKKVRFDVKFLFMPGPSFAQDDGNYIIKYPRNNPPVPEFLALGNCFYYSLPEKYQDMGPRVILEAMASGLSCIADSWSGGAKDRIISETGWLCNTKEEYPEIIKTLTPEILREKGEASKQRAIDHFIPERWIEEILGK